MMLISEDDKLNDPPSSIVPLRCEVEKTLQGGYCELFGQVGFKGLLVCERHARLLGAQDRRALLEGIVYSLELCSRSIPLRKNKALSILLRAQRAQATRELTHALEDLRRATEEKKEEEEEDCP
jgi:hypothetical protein